MTTDAHDAAASRGPATAGPAAVWSAMSIVYVVWGSTYLAIAVAIDTMPPLLALGTRFLAAAAVLGAFVAVRRGPGALRVRRQELQGAVLIGLLLLGVGMGVLTLAERYVPTGVAALIVAVVPVWIVLLRARSGDRPSWVTWVGVVVGLVGIAMLVRPDASASGGDVVVDPGARTLWSLLMLGSTFCWAFGTFLQPRIATPRDPLVLTTYEMLTGGLALSLVGLVRGEHVGDLAHASGASWWAWAYLVVLGSLVAYTAFVWVVGHAPVSLVATYAYVNPVVAVALGWWLRGESVTLGLLAGALVVVVGVALTVSGERLVRHDPDTPTDAAEDALLTTRSQAEH